jgi:RNA polymerase sigma factor (sigma-70 family)
MRDDPTVVELVARARRGDQAGWDALVERYAPLVWSICRRYRLTDEDAHDVGQTVWLRLVEHLRTLRVPAALPGWLSMTTRRECIRVSRLADARRRQELTPEFEIAADEEATMVDRWLIAEERAVALRAAFAQLDARCKELLTLLMSDPPLAYAAIGERMGMPVGGIGPNRSRCLARLRGAPELRRLLDDGSADEGSG